MPQSAIVEWHIKANGISFKQSRVTANCVYPQISPILKSFGRVCLNHLPSVLCWMFCWNNNPWLPEDIFSTHRNLLMCFEETYFQYVVFLDLKLTDSMIWQRSSQGYPPFWGQINKLSPEVGLQGWDEMIFRDWYPSKQLIYTNRGWLCWNAIFFWSMRHGGS